MAETQVQRGTPQMGTFVPLRVCVLADLLLPVTISVWGIPAFIPLNEICLLKLI